MIKYRWQRCCWGKGLTLRYPGSSFFFLTNWYLGHMRVKTNLLQFFSLITYHKVETAEGHTALLRAVKNRLLPMVNPSFLLINKPFFVFIRGILQYYPMWGYFSEEPSSPNGKPFFSFMVSFNIIQCGDISILSNARISQSSAHCSNFTIVSGDATGGGRGRCWRNWWGWQ